MDSFIVYQNQKIEIKDNKYNMKDIFKILNYENYEDYFKSKDIIYYSLSEIKNDFMEEQEDIDLINHLELYSKELNIFDFMKIKNYTIYNDEIFKELWLQIYNKKEILITPNLLNFINNFNEKNTVTFSDHVFKYEKKLFIKFLNENEIDFEQIEYTDLRCNNYNYILNDIKNSDKRTIHLKKYILLTIDNFKQVAMIKSKYVRLYYIEIEKILSLYFDYISKFNIQKGIQLSLSLQNKLTIKDQEILIRDQEILIRDQKISIKDQELIKANKKAKRINQFMNNITIKSNKLEWIYISSNDNYQKDKIYKIGSTERLHKRISNYQTGHPDDYYYVYVKKCYNSKDLDHHIKTLLKSFQYKKNNELYCGINIDDLIDIVNFIIENYDKSLEYLYDFIKNKLENSLSRDPIIMKALDITSISYVINDQVETINIEEENRALVKEQLFKILENIDNNKKLNKKELLNDLNINMNKNDAWGYIKDILDWKNSKSILNYNDKKFYIKF